MLPATLRKTLIQKLESALRPEADTLIKSKQTVSLFRQAFFDVIIDLFQDYKRYVTTTKSETFFDTRKFVDENHPEYREFFHRYFEIDERGGTSNSNQMFNNFIEATCSKLTPDTPEEQLRMCEHMKAAIQKSGRRESKPQKKLIIDKDALSAIVETAGSRSPFGKLDLSQKGISRKRDEQNSHVLGAVPDCPLPLDELVTIAQQDQMPISLSLCRRPTRANFRYAYFPVPSRQILESAQIAVLSEIASEKTTKKQKINLKVQAP